MTSHKMLKKKINNYLDHFGLSFVVIGFVANAGPTLDLPIFGLYLNGFEASTCYKTDHAM